jgi:hypothetical protein
MIQHPSNLHAWYQRSGYPFGDKGRSSPLLLNSFPLRECMPLLLLNYFLVGLVQKFTKKNRISVGHGRKWKMSRPSLVRSRGNHFIFQLTILYVLKLMDEELGIFNPKRLYYLICTKKKKWTHWS